MDNQVKEDSKKMREGSKKEKHFSYLDDWLLDIRFFYIHLITKTYVFLKST